MHLSSVLLVSLLASWASATQLSDRGLCTIEGDSTDCALACSEMTEGNGICVYDRCYCTDTGIGNCDDNNHEGCDAICQDLSESLIGFCMDNRCNCLS
ncbi:uncharacterized protein BYT42DRAFT_572387 [Radiomyces spectabilis]|uniref:uncharacterized protein n=1 Tax=Radiomyces spectabilis TaxID=64574 RepID=UPI00221FB5A0|nr:uncharacterized protein BYT42DRAFT_572387 [Radiomyces spectabilis]KAI8377987.1 hypothetical protein BYT42DRAFT_572387 [Radiomyces spectabilis]